MKNHLGVIPNQTNQKLNVRLPVAHLSNKIFENTLLYNQFYKLAFHYIRYN